MQGCSIRPQSSDAGLRASGRSKEKVTRAYMLFVFMVLYFIHVYYHICVFFILVTIIHTVVGGAKAPPVRQVTIIHTVVGGAKAPPVRQVTIIHTLVGGAKAPPVQ